VQLNGSLKPRFVRDWIDVEECQMSNELVGFKAFAQPTGVYFPSWCSFLTLVVS
jgi:hypothetical protein